MVYAIAEQISSGGASLPIRGAGLYGDTRQRVGIQGQSYFYRSLIKGSPPSLPPPPSQSFSTSPEHIRPDHQMCSLPLPLLCPLSPCPLLCSFAPLPPPPGAAGARDRSKSNGRRNPTGDSVRVVVGGQGRFPLMVAAQLGK